MRRKTLGMKIFTVFNYAFLTLLAISCLLPMLNQLAISFSSSSAVAAGEVGLLPVDFTLDSYKYMADKPEFWKSLSVSLGRILLAVPISMIVCVLAAFPLSRLDHEFPARKYYIWVFVVPMLIGGGLIPTYMVVRNTGLIDSIWSLVLPNAVNVFNTILLMNFFLGYSERKIGNEYGRNRSTVNYWKLAALKQLRKELEETKHEE